MENQYLAQRLAGIQEMLNAAHKASKPLSSSSKGRERESFIKSYLAEVLPPIYRFGTGDATDSYGARSGQLDVVIEYPIAPSLPNAGTGHGQTRLYLAESVAAVIEVKSDAADQWNEAVETASKLASLRRSFGSRIVVGQSPSVQIPLFVAGYTGWSQEKTLLSKLADHPEIAGILIIDSGLFAARGLNGKGPFALWSLIVALHGITNSLKAASPNLRAYAP